MCLVYEGEGRKTATQSKSEKAAIKSVKGSRDNKKTGRKTMNLYVGNLSYDATEEDLRELFGRFGTVDKASLMRDKISGQSRGFAFVEMASKEEAEKAIGELNGKDLKGRAITVNEARPKVENSERRGGGGFGGGHGRRSGGGGGRDRDRY